MAMKLRPDGCHWHRHACIGNRTKRQEKRYKDTCKIDWLVANNGWDTKYSLVLIWGCEKPVLKRYGLKLSLSLILTF